ncbi:MAG TPA: peroxiredoxin [Firmicutes bacterium]|nr:peroxiredoxin [Bacillota bacterium]
MQSKLIWNNQMGFSAAGESGHLIIMDADTANGGAGQGLRPMELLLHGLGGCTGMDVVSILKKMQIDLENFSIEINAERAPEHPKRFTNIHLIFKMSGPNINRDKAYHAIELSQTKYCSVAASLNAKISYELIIE